MAHTSFNDLAGFADCHKCEFAQGFMQGEWLAQSQSSRTNGEEHFNGP